MSLESLSLVNFRSYSDQKFELGPGINLVVGPNASGKTNLLESLYVLASTKSFRSKDRDLVRHEQTHYRIVGSDGDTEYALAYQTTETGQEKRASHNGTRRPLVQHIGNIQVVLFEPGDLQMVSGPPDGRRRYLDYILCQTDRDYLLALTKYRRVLRQRNSLLSNFDTGRIKDEIFAWDVKLTELASEVYNRRQGLINYLNGLIEDSYASIAGSQTPFSLSYVASVDGEDYGAAFIDKLAANLTGDLAAGFTTIGPHREDFKVSFRGQDINTVASRGEVRTVVLALKLAELEYSQQASSKKPILLLDDVFSELDSQRRHDLIKRLKDHQTIITTTEADSVIPDLKAGYNIIKTGGGHA